MNLNSSSDEADFDAALIAAAIDAEVAAASPSENIDTVHATSGQIDVMNLDSSSDGADFDAALIAVVADAEVAAASPSENIDTVHATSGQIDVMNLDSSSDEADFDAALIAAVTDAEVAAASPSENIDTVHAISDQVCADSDDYAPRETQVCGACHMPILDDDGEPYFTSHVCCHCNKPLHSYIVCSKAYMPEEGRYFCSVMCETLLYQLQPALDVYPDWAREPNDND